MQTLNFELQDLLDFIAKARHSVLTAGETNMPSSRPGSHDSFFSEDSWQYSNSFFGLQNLIGHEILHFEGNPAWGMAYSGQILQHELPENDLRSFLKFILLKCCESNGFLKGASYSDGDKACEDTCCGDATHFSGEALIYFNKHLVYRLSYFGGLVTGNAERC